MRIRDSQCERQDIDRAERGTRLLSGMGGRVLTEQLAMVRREIVRRAGGTDG